MAHTPGPWHGRHNGDDPVDGMLIEDSTNRALALVNCPEETVYEGNDYKTYTHPDVLFANAHLIAAAPELLDALKDALAELSPLMQAYRGEHADTICGRARAAIAKAEGRS